MKKFISNSINIYHRVTSETSTHFICGNTMYLKSEVLINYHPLDNLDSILHLHVVPFYN